ncbi:MAG: glycosyltransferase family 1 protein [Sellimonas sp.]|uniref:glycosyltransferase family 1 protein n=1 Tax=Sellimonas sp. TaxID=2021466 RepID=UPI0039A2EF92
MIRVLHIVTYMGIGGLETMLMNYYRHIDRKKIQFDFLVHRDFEAAYDQEIMELGGRIYRLPRLNPISPYYKKQLDEFFAKHTEYKIVHSHLDCMSAIPLKFAKKNDILVRIAHSHSSSQTKDKKYYLKLYYKSKIKKYATELFACSEAAGQWMFNTNRFHILNNAIDTDKYIYDPVVREFERKKLDISKETIVIGHVGRFAPPKNHRYLIELFDLVRKRIPNTILLMIGNGELRSQAESQVKELGLEGKVIFTGQRTDVSQLLQAMDIFVFPSIYEGLPVSLIEAQAAGLPCLISDKVPIECKKTDLVKQISLDDMNKWVELIISAEKVIRRDTSDEIRKAGFDINSNAKKLEDFYFSAYFQVI